VRERDALREKLGVWQKPVIETRGEAGNTIYTI
jgi:hypothetical protein